MLWFSSDGRLRDILATRSGQSNCAEDNLLKEHNTMTRFPQLQHNIQTLPPPNAGKGAQQYY